MGMTRPFWKTAGYQFFKTSFWLIAKLCFCFRWKGREYFPRDTGRFIRQPPELLRSGTGRHLLPATDQLRGPQDVV